MLKNILKSVKICGILLILLIPSSVLALSAKRHFEAGDDYFKQGLYPKAIDEYSQAIKVNSYYKEAYNNLGEAYFAFQLYDKAEENFKAAANLDPNYLEPINNLGLLYEERGLLSQAKEEYEKVLELNPLNKEAHFNLARLLFKRGYTKKAIGKLKDVLRLDPNYTLAYINLGSIYYIDEEYRDLDKAIGYYQKAKEIDEENLFSYLSLGYLYIEEGWKDRAISEYEKAKEISPENLTVLVNLASLYMEKRQWEKAADLYKKIIKLTESPSTQILTKTRKNLITIYEDRPDLLLGDLLAHYNLGLAFEHLGEEERAAKEYQEALRIDPYDEVALHRLEEILLKREPVGTSLRNKYSLIHHSLGDYFFKRRLKQLANYEYNRSVDLNPQNGKNRFDLSQLHLYKKLTDQAVEELKKVLELEPGNAEARDCLEATYYELESQIAAREGIDLSSLPPSGVKAVVFAFNSSNTPHLELDYFADYLMFSLLNRWPQVMVISPPKTKESLEETKLDKIRSLVELLSAGQLCRAQYGFWANMKESLNTIKVEAYFYDLSTLTELFKVEVERAGHYRMREVIDLLAKKAIENLPLQGEIIKIDPLKEEAILNLGTEHGLKKDDLLEVFEAERIFKNPVSGERIGLSEKPIGKLKVVEVNGKVCRTQMITPDLVRFARVGHMVRLIRE